jgi:hypothetical protein
MRIGVNLEALHAEVALMSNGVFDFSLERIPSGLDSVEIRLKQGIEIEDLDDIDWSGPVASYQGHQVLFYIGDQGWKIDNVIAEPAAGRRFHMSWCSTLEDMKKKGRIERYIATADLSGRFKVFGQSEDHGEERHASVGLKVCKNCLSNINYKNFSRNRKSVFDNFDIPEFFEHYSAYFEHKPSGEVDPTRGYTGDWDAVSQKKREQENWRCEQCTVDLLEHSRLLHVHHINGVKSDNRQKNLSALCAECHSKQPSHEHMRVSLDELRTLDGLRRA